MSFSTVSTSPQGTATVSRSRLGWLLAHSRRIPLAEVAQAWAPLNMFPYSQLVTLQDARLYWPCIHHSAGQQYSPSVFRLIMVSNACPQCQRQPKLLEHRFCSVACNQSAAFFAPELKYLPLHHERFMMSMYFQCPSFVKRTGSISPLVETRFMQCWKPTTPCPRVSAVYMITWTKSSQESFQRYR